MLNALKAKATSTGVMITMESVSRSASGDYLGSTNQVIFVGSEAEMDAIIERLQAARAAQWSKPAVLPLIPDAAVVKDAYSEAPAPGELGRA